MFFSFYYLLLLSFPKSNIFLFIISRKNVKKEMGDLWKCDFLVSRAKAGVQKLLENTGFLLAQMGRFLAIHLNCMKVRWKGEFSS